MDEDEEEEGEFIILTRSPIGTAESGCNPISGRARILWLHGPAGAGKSAVAQTVSEIYEERKILAGSFFFSLGSAGRGTAKYVFPTLAYQIAMRIPGMRSRIDSIVASDFSIFDKSLDVQINDLIVRPFESLGSSADALPTPVPFLVVIDGLDECGGKASDRVQTHILALIANLVYKHNVPLCFLLVSRPELHIQHMLRSKAFCSHGIVEEISLSADQKFRHDEAHEGARAFLEPTAGEYAGERGKEFLKILETVAQEIPIPGVGAVKIATNLIKGCEESHASLERVEELKLRIQTLAAALVSELKGKKAEDIQAKLKEDINSLEKDLTYIQSKLDQIASQDPLLVMNYKSFKEEKVRKCNVLRNLEKQIRIFHSNQQQLLNIMQDGVKTTMEDVEDMKTTMKDAEAILYDVNRPTAVSSSPQLGTRARIPANTGNFHGRDALVAELVRVLMNVSDGQERPRVCLLGPGGMGKTCTARAIMAHPDMKQYLPDGSRVWVPCVKATSVSLFLDTLYSSLGTTRNTGNTHDDIIFELQSSEGLVLLLDNFETPWSIVGGRAEVEQILRDISQVPRISFLVTMRSAIPPCDDIQWHVVNLPAVDSDAARRIYSNIYANGRDDVNLPELLELVGHMPLAITLMAKVGKLTGLSAEDLVKEYNENGTAMLEQGSDKEHSMDICIGLSVYGPSMERHPKAFNLLATLAMLPVGTTYNKLKNWWARSLPNLSGALAVLREISLVEEQNSTFVVLPVIRRYILDPSRFPPAIRISMIESACNFLSQHTSSRKDDMHKDHTAALSIEEGNLQGILLESTQPTPKLISSLLALARHQHSTRPRTDVIQHALKLVHDMKNNSNLLGAIHLCCGDILADIDQYDDAREHYTLARDSFLSIRDMKQAAECLLEVATVNTTRRHSVYQDEKALIEKARLEFEAIDDPHGLSLCLYHSGTLRWQYGGSQGSYIDAINLMQRARAASAELGDIFQAAKCAHQLAVVYRLQLNYDQVKTWATLAMEELRQSGYFEYLSDPLRMLARASIATGDYDAALKLLIQALESSKSYGSPIDIAEALEHMGRAWAKMGERLDAREAFGESLRMYSSVKAGAQGEIRCRLFLRRLEDSSLSPTGEEADTLYAHYEDIENIM
ncbi:hypothetical protein FPV67DRAFT_783699 [Lyophyllum atratum]|nr:hypothetical protein FPV67DRAFT_783699 [Lyophyllum atratum]